MKYLKLLSIFVGIFFMQSSMYAQENAAPSMHLTYYFPSNTAMLKMQKIKITQSAFASYFEVNWWSSGYTGLQQTPDTSYGNSNILISSLWDPNTLQGILASVDYKDPTTFKFRFGGEGDGWKTINPYNWELNKWYNVVNRSWKSGGRLYIGTFINNITTGKWFHTATFSSATTDDFLAGTNDAFLENWDGTNTAWNGSFKRKAFFKDLWNLNAAGVWEKNTSAYFSANNSPGDIVRNGIYHNSFNALYDATENAYMMQHGGSTTPSAAFNNGRTLTLPAQTNQGTSPTLTIVDALTLSANYNAGTTNVNWTIDSYKSPQLVAKVEIINATGTVVKTEQQTLPELRNMAINFPLADGNYTAKLTLQDIFNQFSLPKITNFTVGTALNTNNINTNSKVEIYPNPASTFIHIEGANLKTATMIDASGKLLKKHALKQNKNRIDVSNFSKGIYFIMVTDQEQKTYTEKIVVQ